ncbi:hypothetical protein D3C74_128130 [compost metagenome]
MTTANYPEKHQLIEAIRQADGLGHKVAIVLPRNDGQVRRFMDKLVTLSNPLRVKLIRRVNGLEGITFHNGGEIRFFAPARTIRGYSCDVLIASSQFSEEQMKEIVPANFTRKNPMLIRLGDFSAQP